MKSKCYDKFNCIASECSMTCCEGWEIERSDSPKCMELLAEYIEDKAETQKCDDAMMRCPLLTEERLCSLVLKYSDKELPRACSIFPRNLFDNMKGEACYELSFGCPEVVDIYNREKQAYPMVKREDCCSDYGRMAMDIFHTDSMPLDIRMLAIYLYLNDMLQAEDEAEFCELENDLIGTGENGTEQHNHTSKKQYQNVSEYLNIAADTILNDEPMDDFQCLNSSFLNLIVNYCELPIMSPYLLEIFDSLEEIEKDYDKVYKMFLRFQIFKEDFDEKLEENLLCLSIFEAKLYEALENADDVYDMERNFEAVLYEFAFLRYALFATSYIYATYPDYETIRGLIVCMSRMIGHNEEAFFDFISEEPALLSIIR